MKSKLIALILILCLAAVSCGCAGQNSSEESGSGQNASLQSASYQKDSSDDLDKEDIYKNCYHNIDADNYYDLIEDCAEQIREKTDFEPDIAIVLGSGLGDFADSIEVECEIPYSEIEGFPVSTVQGHEGKLVFGTYEGKKLVLMKGRLHYYEGYSMYEVVLPIRVLAKIGAGTVILTNAVGALNPDYSVGDFVVIRDHISSFVPSPLIGENIDELGERFTDMTEIYDKKLQKTALKAGKETGVTVQRGVYIQTTGPQFETPAEITMYRSMGADTVAMSLAVEAIAARHMGMKVCGISCVSNMAAGMEDKKLTADDINDNMDENVENFSKLMAEMLKCME